MAVPTFEAMMLPVLQLFAEGRTSIRECLQELGDRLGLSEDERETRVPSGKVTVLYDRAQWARTYLSKAGLLHQVRRNHYVITDRGRQLLSREPDRIDKKLLAEFSEYREWKIASVGAAPPRDTQPDAADAPGQDDGSSTPEERIEQAMREIDEALRLDLMERILASSPAFFEQLVVDVLQGMGYGGRTGEAKVVGRSGDGGIDGVINEDALGLDIIYIQAKRYALDSRIGRPAIQQFVGSLTGEGATRGVFVTTSGFSREAIEYAQRVSQRVVLIDGDQLTRLMVSYGVGVQSRHSYRVMALDENYFEDE